MTASDNTITCHTSTEDTVGFEFSIIGVEKDNFNDMTTVGFNDINELIKILSDFKARWNSLKKD